MTETRRMPLGNILRFPRGFVQRQESALGDQALKVRSRHRLGHAAVAAKVKEEKWV